MLLLSIKSIPDACTGDSGPHSTSPTTAMCFKKIQTLPRNMLNSIFVTPATVVITTVCAVLAGYALVHLRLRGARFVVACCWPRCSSRPGWSR